VPADVIIFGDSVHAPRLQELDAAKYPGEVFIRSPNMWCPWWSQNESRESWALRSFVGAADVSQNRGREPD
jgi:hypothetical protein